MKQQRMRPVVGIRKKKHRLNGEKMARLLRRSAVQTAEKPFFRHRSSIAAKTGWESARFVERFRQDQHRSCRIGKGNDDWSVLP